MADLLRLEATVVDKVMGPLAGIEKSLRGMAQTGTRDLRGLGGTSHAGSEIKLRER